jgi:hypothetical protein
MDSASGGTAPASTTPSAPTALRPRPVAIRRGSCSFAGVDASTVQRRRRRSETASSHDCAGRPVPRDPPRARPTLRVRVRPYGLRNNGQAAADRASRPASPGFRVRPSHPVRIGRAGAGSAVLICAGPSRPIWSGGIGGGGRTSTSVADTSGQRSGGARGGTSLCAASASSGRKEPERLSAPEPARRLGWIGSKMISLPRRL